MSAILSYLQSRDNKATASDSEAKVAIDEDKPVKVCPKSDVQIAIHMINQMDTQTAAEKYIAQKYIIEHPSYAEGFIIVDPECQELFIDNLLK